METTLSVVSNWSVNGESGIERWKKFFNYSDKVSEEKKGLYAMGRLVQFVLTNYMQFRKVYPIEMFKKRKYGDFIFFTVNKETEEGEKLDEVVRTIGKFVHHSALKSVRLQLFHDPEKPKEIGEELCIQLYYGEQQRIKLNFGDDINVDLDLSERTFERFVHRFGEFVGKLKSHCVFLAPLPDNCEKHFRTSFYKKAPVEIDTRFFNNVSGPVEYASEIKANELANTCLGGVGLATVLRTCYSGDDFEGLLMSTVPGLIESELDKIFGKVDVGLPVEVARQVNEADEQSYQDTANGLIAPASTDEVPIQDEERPRSQHLTGMETSRMSDLVRSPVFDQRSVASMEVVMSSFGHNDSTFVINDTARSGDLDVGSGIDEEPVSPDDHKSPPKENLRRSSRQKKKKAESKQAPVSEEEDDLSDEDSFVRRRKNSSKRKLPNAEAIQQEMAKGQKKRR